LSYCEDGKSCDYLNLDSYDQIYTNYSKSLKKGLKKSRRNLAKLGEVEYVIDENRADIEKSFNEFLEIESSGWKGKKDGNQEGQAIKLDKKQLAFYKKLISQFSKKGNCQIHSLKIEKNTIASLILLREGNTCFGIKMAYNENYAKISPGTILLDYILQYLSGKNDIAYFNFLSESTWAQGWHPNKFFGYKLFLFNKTIKGIIYYLSFSINRNLKNKIRLTL
jgi:CelD/BcsL family acetyltransferase involved in cellulose biosynthesis